MSYSRSLVLFGDDFDVPESSATVEPAAEALSPPPSYDQAALDAACAAAHADGYATGIVDAAATDTARAATALATIAERLGDAAAAAARTIDESASALARLVLAAVLAGYPALGKRHGLEEVRALMHKIMPGLLQEPRVTFHVHPTMVSAITDELAAVPWAERQHMSIEPTEAIPPGDARVTWPHGEALRDTGDVLTAIAEVLRPFGLLPEPQADAKPDPADAGAKAR